MNILLVLPRIFINLAEPEHFPVGMAYVSSSLKKAGHNVTILNLNFEKGEVTEIIRRTIQENDIKIVETGGLVTHYWMLKEIIDAVKEVDENIYTLVGGGFVTGDPELAMQCIPNADFGVFGEGEITNVEVSNAIEGKIKFSDVNGLIFRKRFQDNNCNNNEFVKNPPRKEIENLDDIPWPDYEGFSLDKMLELAPKKYVTMSTGRSCKFRCTFCFHTSGQNYRQRSLNSFFQELDYLVEKYGIDNIYITDELFANDIDRLNEFCNRIKKYNILWAIQLRVNIVTKALLQLLKDSGCIIISFGLESADNKVLRSMRKGITVEMIENALKCSYEVGIEAHGAFIFGDIMEDEETVNNTLRWWNEHREYNIGLALIQVFPGTYLYQYACENGIIKDKLEFIRQGCPYINVSKLSDDDYIKLGIKLEQTMSNTFQDIEDLLEIVIQEKNRINFTARCPICGDKLFGNRVSIAKIAVIKCRKCNNNFTFNPYRIYKNYVEKNLREIFDFSSKVAFWGANDIFSALYRVSDYLKGVDFSIISSNNVMFNQKFNNHVIQSENILEEGEINTVIVCDYIYDNYVRNYILTRYKNIKNIISVSKLIENTY